MEFIVGLVVAVKSLVFLGGFLSAGAPHAVFADTRIMATAQEIELSCRIDHAFPDELRKLALTGTPVIIYVFAELHQSENDTPIASAALENCLVYDMVKKQFILQSGAHIDTIAAADSAFGATSACKTLALAPLRAVQKNRAYRVSVYAVLGKVRVEALHNNDIDLMYFWNYQRPSMRTEWFSGAQLLALLPK